MSPGIGAQLGCLKARARLPARSLNAVNGGGHHLVLWQQGTKIGEGKTDAKHNHKLVHKDVELRLQYARSPSAIFLHIITIGIA